MENSIRKLLEKNKTYKFSSPQYMVCKKYVLGFFKFKCQFTKFTNHIWKSFEIAHAHFDKKYSKINETIISKFWIGLWHKKVLGSLDSGGQKWLNFRMKLLIMNHSVVVTH